MNSETCSSSYSESVGSFVGATNSTKKRPRFQRVRFEEIHVETTSEESMKLNDRLQAASKFITRKLDEIDNMFR
jgi:hypothetical protein